MGDPQAYQKMLTLSWSDVHAKTKELGEKLKPLGPWRGIVGVPRGGLFAASIVARVLKVKHIDTFCINTYDFQTHGEPEIIKAIKDPQDGEGLLVIDDLVDRGTTFKVIREHLPKAHYACVYAKPEGKPQTDTFLEEVPQDMWIDHPWEDDGS